VIEWRCPNCSTRVRFDPADGVPACPNCQAPGPAPLPEDSAWVAVDSADPCPRCGEPVPPPRAQARMGRKARLLLLACVPLNIAWIFPAGMALMLVPAPGAISMGLCLGVVAVCFAPTLILAWWARSLPRTVTVRCRGCGWYEERAQRPK
jgi:hypothetical protein